MYILCRSQYFQVHNLSLKIPKFWIDQSESGKGLHDCQFELADQKWVYNVSLIWLAVTTNTRGWNANIFNEYPSIKQVLCQDFTILFNSLQTKRLRFFRKQTSIVFAFNFCTLYWQLDLFHVFCHPPPVIQKFIEPSRDQDMSSCPSSSSSSI